MNSCLNIKQYTDNTKTCKGSERVINTYFDLSIACSCISFDCEFISNLYERRASFVLRLSRSFLNFSMSRSNSSILLACTRIILSLSLNALTMLSGMGSTDLVPYGGILFIILRTTPDNSHSAPPSHWKLSHTELLCVQHSFA